MSEFTLGSLFSTADYSQTYEQYPYQTTQIELAIGGHVEIDHIEIDRSSVDKRLENIRVKQLRNGNWKVKADYFAHECDVGSCSSDGIHRFDGSYLCETHLETATNTVG